MKIEIREYIEKQPNGDRATTLSDSSRFVVVLAKNGKEVELLTFDCYDRFAVSVLPRERVWTDAYAYAKSVSDMLEIDLEHRIFNKMMVTSAAWVEQ